MIYQGDARSIPLPDGCVQCVVTSPPYYSLRDYGVDGQIGLEATPEAYLEQMVAVFREVKRVLKDDGTVFLNMGDSYFGANWRGSEAIGSKQATNRGANGSQHSLLATDWRGKKHPVYKPKDLMGMPWRLAFALQADGWYLRSDIIWAKPNPMPESVTDRPTRSHEYIFLLSKRDRYFYDADAVREAVTGGTHDPGRRSPIAPKSGCSPNGFIRDKHGNDQIVNQRNKRSVWTIPSEPCPDAHFATFPQKLVEPCVLAGTSAKGECIQCGKNWVRETAIPYDENHPTYNEWRKTNARGKFANGERVQGDNKGQGGTVVAYYREVWDSDGSPRQTTGWRPTCQCNAGVRPNLVFDSFLGSGTVGIVCERLGRRWAGTELNPDYIAIARKRTSQQGLFSHAG